MNDRAVIRDSVIRRAPVDDRERASQLAFVEHFDRLAEPFSEAAGPVHVTGSAIVVGRRGVVLHLHKRLGTWLQPGGHIEPGEQPWEGALREAREETGLDVAHPGDGPRLVHVDVHPGPRGHTHLDLRYLLTSPDDDPCPAEGESQDARWFSWDEAAAVVDEALAAALRALRASLAAEDTNVAGGLE